MNWLPHDWLSFVWGALSTVVVVFLRSLIQTAAKATWEKAFPGPLQPQLFERRHAIFTRVRDALDRLIASPKQFVTCPDGVAELTRLTSDAKAHCEDDFRDVIAKLAQEAEALRSLYEKHGAPPVQQDSIARNEIDQRIIQQLRWFEDQRAELERFRPILEPRGIIAKLRRRR